MWTLGPGPASVGEVTGENRSHVVESDGSGDQRPGVYST